MKKTILFALILFCGLPLAAQPGQFANDKDLPYTNPKPMYLEAHVFEKDSVYVCFVSYKVSLSNLVFTKNSGDYAGGITLNVEALEENGNVVRSATTDEIYVKNYSDTDARDKYLEGVLSFNLNEYVSELNPLIGISNTEREFPMPPIRLEPETIEAARPVIVEKLNRKCSGGARYKLVNFGNSIPYGNPDAEMLIPVLDTGIQKIKVELKQDEKVVRQDSLFNSVMYNFSIEKCENNIFLSSDAEFEKRKYFILPRASEGLAEGRVTVSVYGADSLLCEHQLEIIWDQKPRSLFNPEYAYKLLKIIADKDTLKSILDRNDGRYYPALKEFWDRRNPDGESSYNALEAEFYNRVDYALKEFAIRGSRSGELSDRGEIYVKYGKPSDVQRVYSGKGVSTEVWKYNSLNLQFVFVDTKGFGNYRLQ